MTAFTTGSHATTAATTWVIAAVSLALMAPASAVPSEDDPVQPNAVTEYEVDQDSLRSVAYWPREVMGPQQVAVEVEGPAALSGNMWIGVTNFKRRFGGKKKARWERTLTPQPPERGGGIIQSVYVSVTRDRRMWNSSNLDKMPKGKMFCRIFVNGQLIVEHSAPYRWNDIVNSASCEIEGTRY